MSYLRVLCFVWTLISAVISTRAVFWADADGIIVLAYIRDFDSHPNPDISICYTTRVAIRFMPI